MSFSVILCAVFVYVCLSSKGCALQMSLALFTTSHTRDVGLENKHTHALVLCDSLFKQRTQPLQLCLHC